MFVTGHVHHNRVFPHLRRNGSGFWQVTTASHMSYPEQTRLIELMDNGDGTLSIFGTVLDTAAPIGFPASGTPAADMSDSQPASISRLLAANVRGARQGHRHDGQRCRPASRQRGARAARPTPPPLSERQARG